VSQVTATNYIFDQLLVIVAKESLPYKPTHSNIINSILLRFMQWWQLLLWWETT